MASPPDSSFAERLGESLCAQADTLSRRWLERLSAAREVPAGRIFPTRTLLDHIPKLLRRVFEGLGGERDESSRQFVLHEIEQLARLRIQQGYAVDEVVAELDELRRVVFDAFRQTAAAAVPAPSPTEVVDAAGRLEEGLQELVRGTALAYRDVLSAARGDRAELLGRFGRAVSHELRNRLNAARLTLELLRETSPDEEPSEFERLLERTFSLLRSLEGAARDVQAVVLTQQRPDQGEARRMPLRDLVREVASDAAELFREYGVELRVEDDLPGFPVDAARLQLVMMNLLTNGAKYSDPGKRQRQVAVRARREGPSAWRVEVTDNGVGIPEEGRERLFEPEYRAHTRGAREQERPPGQGLGLALVREAVAQMGGSIEVESRPGAGSTFAILLPEPAEEPGAV